jgi:hypothetical protein
MFMLFASEHFEGFARADYALSESHGELRSRSFSSKNGNGCQNLENAERILIACRTGKSKIFSQ